MISLERAARERFGRRPISRLPIAESFSASVFRFLDADGHKYVLKRHGTLRKARQEIRALRLLARLESVPRLLDVHEDEGYGELLMTGLDASPWTDIAGTSDRFMRELGRALRELHAVGDASFDGHLSWHALLSANIDRYVELVAGPDAALVDRARRAFVDRFDEIPRSTSASLIHLDLRPGNILASEGRFVAIIDFEAARGGHPSMDLFKLWDQVFSVIPSARGWLLDGYGAAEWLADLDLERLMQIYGLYHGVAGLAWCAKRGQGEGEFASRNRGIIDRCLATV